MKSTKVFRRWLSQRFEEIETICELGRAGFLRHQLDIAALVAQACRYACRFGGGHLIGTEQPTMTPRQALVVFGRLLAWSEQPDHLPDLLSAHQVAERLGLSVRSVWRMASAGNLPKPIAISGRTLWRAPDVEAMIDLAPARK